DPAATREFDDEPDSCACAGCADPGQAFGGFAKVLGARSGETLPVFLLGADPVFEGRAVLIIAGYPITVCDSCDHITRILSLAVFSDGNFRSGLNRRR